MEALKALFGDKPLTYDELSLKLKENEETIKLANLKDGEYVSKLKLESLQTDSEKKLAEVTKQLEEAQKVANPNDELQKQIEQLTKDKADLETSQADATKQLDRLTKRELASTKTGITNPDFLDLMLMRHGDKEATEFEKAVTDYAKENKQMWGQTTPSPDLNGNPQSGEDVREKRIMEAMGVGDKK